MRRARLAIIVVLAGLAAITAGCGVEGGDASSSGSGSASATTEPEALTGAQQQMVDSIKKTYTDLGFTDEEATCLAEGMAGSMDPGGDPADMADIMGVINDCDIPMERFMDIQEDLGGGSTEDVMKKSMEAGYRNLGMTDEEAACVADGFVEEYGSDITAAQDPEKIQPMLEACGVDPSTLRPGG